MKRKARQISGFILAMLFVICTYIPAARALSITNEAELNLDVMFVMDRSGSMKYSDPDGLAMEASQLFTSMCKEGSCRAGYVMYTTQVLASQGLTDISGIQNREAFKRLMTASGKVDDGDTDPARGMARALELMTNSDTLDGNHNPLIIMLSDGNTDLPNGERTVAESDQHMSEITAQLAELSIPVYTIGLNFDGTLNESYLSNISNTTGGKSFAITSATEIPGTLSAIFADHINTNLTDLASFITDGSTRDVPVEIPNSSVFEANIVVQYTGAQPTLALRSPDGNQVAMNSDTCKMVVSTHYTLIKLIQPAMGTWMLSIGGAPGCNVTVSFLSSYNTVLVGEHSWTQLRAGNLYDYTAKLMLNDQVVEDEELFSGLKGVVYLKDVESGEVSEYPLSVSGSTLSGTFEIDKEASGKTYQIWAEASSEDGSLNKSTEAEQYEIELPAITLSEKGNAAISKTVMQLFAPKATISAADLIEGIDHLSLAVEKISYQDGSDSVFSVEGDTPLSTLTVTALAAGKGSCAVTVVDQDGQSVELNIEVNVISMWIPILAVLIVLAVISVLFLLRYRASFEALEGSIQVGFSTPQGTQSAAQFDLFVLAMGNSVVPLNVVFEEAKFHGMEQVMQFLKSSKLFGKKKRGILLKIGDPGKGCQISREGAQLKKGSTVSLYPNSILKIMLKSSSGEYQIILGLQGKGGSGGFGIGSSGGSFDSGSSGSFSGGSFDSGSGGSFSGGSFDSGSGGSFSGGSFDSGSSGSFDSGSSGSFSGGGFDSGSSGSFSGGGFDSGSSGSFSGGGFDSGNSGGFSDDKW